MAAPIQSQHRAMMNALASAIDEALNGTAQPKRIGFVLLTAEFGTIDGGRVNYISNGPRDDVTAMLREILARFEGRAIDTPGHA